LKRIVFFLAGKGRASPPGAALMGFAGAREVEGDEARETKGG